MCTDQGVSQMEQSSTLLSIHSGKQPGCLFVFMPWLGRRLSSALGPGDITRLPTTHSNTQLANLHLGKIALGAVPLPSLECWEIGGA